MLFGNPHHTAFSPFQAKAGGTSMAFIAICHDPTSTRIICCVLQWIRF